MNTIREMETKKRKKKEKQMNLLDIKITTAKWEIHLMDLRTDSFMKKTSVNLKMGQQKLSKLSTKGRKAWKKY